MVVDRAGIQSPSLSHFLMSPLQLQPHSLRGTAERTQALGKIQIVVTGQDAFGETLRHANGVGEVQDGGVDGNQDVFAHQPARVFMHDVSGRFWAVEFGNVSFECSGVALPRSLGELHPRDDKLADSRLDT